jgi:hypothetical protein
MKLSKMNLNELVIETRRIKARLKVKSLETIERDALKAQLAIVTAHHNARISRALGVTERTKC